MPAEAAKPRQEAKTTHVAKTTTRAAKASHSAKASRQRTAVRHPSRTRIAKASRKKARVVSPARTVRKPVARGRASTRHGVRNARIVRPAATKPLIIIDAGHGGADSGAVGVSGTLEKTVTLATALELKRQLLATRRYRVLLTRENDRFIPLSHRVALVRAHNPALFISLHADASVDRSARGASVYVRSSGTSGKPAAGSSALFSPASAAQGGFPSLQYTMVDTLGDDVRMTQDPAREARFHVLGVPAVPSVLLEMGFLSNRQDEALLRQSKHRAIVARAVREAIDDYLRAAKRRPAERL